MRIAVLAPIAWRTPPRNYGPWEQIASSITEGLAKRGHQVTLFATEDSMTCGRLRSVCRTPYEEDKNIDPKVWESIHISEVFSNADEFDIIHNNYDFVPLAFSRLVETPIVTTIHGFSSPRILPAYKRFNDRVFYVSVSNADRSPELDYISTVYNGIEISQFTLNEHPKDYLLFFGRIHRDKGLHDAIDIARKSGRRLRIAGIIQDTRYFEEIKNEIDGEQITFLGPVGPDLRDYLMGSALALLHPIHFAEPFGLSVVESMACGTPVIAYPKGSMPEIIINGENGFLVNDPDEAVSALNEIGQVSRRTCRHVIEERFSADKMVENYIKVYEQVLSHCAREDHRPWGFYQVLSDQQNYKVKKIVVWPDKRLSLQRHRKRSEHWYIVKGEAVVTLDHEDYRVAAGDSIDIPFGAAHRIANRGMEEVIFIEVQRGEYFGEDDIERIEDDFGRVAR